MSIKTPETMAREHIVSERLYKGLSPHAEIALALSPAANLEWQDLSGEAERTYIFADGSEVTIKNPLKLSVKRKPEGDSHRVIADGQSYYIRAGWLAIRWTPKQGRDPYAF